MLSEENIFEKAKKYGNEFQRLLHTYPLGVVENTLKESIGNEKTIFHEYDSQKNELRFKIKNTKEFPEI